MSIGLVLGFFDGVHKAHRALIKLALESSDNVELITFKSSPLVYFGKNAEYIYDREESIEKIYSLGVNKVIELDFNKIASMTAYDYLKYLKETYSPGSIFTGYNHTFGAGRTGDSDFLARHADEFGYKYFCLPPIMFKNNAVSSTFIKQYLKNGDILKASDLLEDKFYIKGNIITGSKIGRTIGFPTANINYPDNIVKVPFGVYSVKVIINNDPLPYKGILNWGYKPTVNHSDKPVAEVHILDFNKDIYDQNIKIIFEKFIRSEKQFKNLDELKEQINRDRISCLEL